MSALKYFPVSPEFLGLHPLAMSLVRTGICLLFSWKINSALGLASAFWAGWERQQEVKMNNTWRITSKKGKSLLLKLSSAATTHYCELFHNSDRRHLSLGLQKVTLFYSQVAVSGTLIMEALQMVAWPRVCVGLAGLFPTEQGFLSAHVFSSTVVLSVASFSLHHQTERLILSAWLYVFLDQLLSTQVSIWDRHCYKVHISFQRGHVRIIFLYELKFWPRCLGSGLSAATVSCGRERRREPPFTSSSEHICYSRACHLNQQSQCTNVEQKTPLWVCYGGHCVPGFHGKHFTLKQVRTLL